MTKFNAALAYDDAVAKSAAAADAYYANIGPTRVATLVAEWTQREAYAAARRDTD